MPGYAVYSFRIDKDSKEALKPKIFVMWLACYAKKENAAQGYSITLSFGNI